MLLMVKAVIWAVALGSGTSGGVLAPLLIMGGGMGAALARCCPPPAPGSGRCWRWRDDGRHHALAAHRDLLRRRDTGNTHVLLPLITACVTAHLVTVLLMRRSILTEKVARRGHHLAREYRVDPFTLTRVREMMATEVQTVPDTMTLQQPAAFLTSPDQTPELPGGRRASACWGSSIRQGDRLAAQRKTPAEHARHIARGA